MIQNSMFCFQNRNNMILLYMTHWRTTECNNLIFIFFYLLFASQFDIKHFINNSTLGLILLFLDSNYLLLSSLGPISKQQFVNFFNFDAVELLHIAKDLFQSKINVQFGFRTFVSSLIIFKLYQLSYKCIVII